MSLRLGSVFGADRQIDIASVHTDPRVEQYQRPVQSSEHLDVPLVAMYGTTLARSSGALMAMSQGTGPGERNLDLGIEASEPLVPTLKFEAARMAEQLLMVPRVRRHAYCFWHPPMSNLDASGSHGREFGRRRDAT